GPEKVSPLLSAFTARQRGAPALLLGRFPVFGVMGGAASPYRPLIPSPAGVPPEPPRSTSDRRSEVLRGGSGAARGRLRCKCGLLSRRRTREMTTNAETYSTGNDLLEAAGEDSDFLGREPP